MKKNKNKELAMAAAEVRRLARDLIIHASEIDPVTAGAHRIEYSKGLRALDELEKRSGR